MVPQTIGKFIRWQKMTNSLKDNKTDISLMIKLWNFHLPNQYITTKDIWKRLLGEQNTTKCSYFNVVDLNNK